MNKLQNKTALVTGGGSGIGLAVARGLLDEGARVAIAGRNEGRLKQAAESLQGGERLAWFAADVASPEQVHTLVQSAVKRFGPVDILVNNAGTNVKERLIRQLTPESWRMQVQANLDGAFFCVHEVLPKMLERRDGVIVNVVSIAGLRASMLGGAAYSAAKFGMHALGLCLAEEVRDSNVRVSNVYPGEVDTPILEFRPNPITDEHRRRILQPQDIAAGVMFVVTLPPHVSVPELVIKPTTQAFL